MNFEFEVDYETQEVSIMLDSVIVANLYKDDEGQLIFSKCRLTSEDVKEKLRDASKLLLEIDDI